MWYAAQTLAGGVPSGEKERSQGGNTPGVGSSVRNMRKEREGERVREGPSDG